MKTPSPEIKWLIQQARPLSGLYGAHLFTVVITSSIDLLDPLIIKWLIDEVLPWRKEEMLLVVAVAFVATFLFHLGLNVLGTIVDTYASQRLMFNMRLRLLQHVQSLSPDYHAASSSGDTLYRMEQDVDRVQDLGGTALASLLRISIVTMMNLAMMMLIHWRLALIVLPLVPFMVVLRKRIHPLLREASDQVQQRSAQRSAFLQEHLLSLMQIHLLNRAGAERRRFARLSREALEAQVRRRTREMVLGASTGLITVIATSVVLAYGGLMVMQGSLTVGGLVAFYTYLGRIFSHVGAGVTLYSTLQRASSSIRRIMDLFAVRPAIADPPRPEKIPHRGALSIELRDVHFQYPSGRRVLDGVSLRIEPGEKVALVGATGCGKSTIARLLTRMYDPSCGTVLVDSIDVRDLHRRHLRSRVALVPQEPVLFNATFRENLLFANPRAGDRELRHAVSLAQLEETLSRLPEGWSERIGPFGARLSGGQRQRIAIARAVLQDPQIMILDEATSALDGFTERRLLEALNLFARQRTVLLIAHRLSAILWADRILVLEDGKLAEDGTHADLSRAGGVYRRLCEEQLRDESPRVAV